MSSNQLHSKAYGKYYKILKFHADSLPTLAARPEYMRPKYVIKNYFFRYKTWKKTKLMPKITWNHFRWTGNSKTFNLISHTPRCTNNLAKKVSKMCFRMGSATILSTPYFSQIWYHVSKLPRNTANTISRSIFIRLSSK